MRNILFILLFCSKICFSQTYFAHAENNVVTSVIVASSDVISKYSGIWIQVGTQTQLYCGIGDTLVGTVIISKRPYPSWTLNGLQWNAPITKPDGDYSWSESQQKWIIGIH